MPDRKARRIEAREAGGNGPTRPIPLPTLWTFAAWLYGLAHCLLDRDGRVIASHFPISNSATMAAAPAMACLLRELIAGPPPERLRERAECILRDIDRGAPREPGEDDD